MTHNKTYTLQEAAEWIAYYGEKASARQIDSDRLNYAKQTLETHLKQLKIRATGIRKTNALIIKEQEIIKIRDSSVLDFAANSISKSEQFSPYESGDYSDIEIAAQDLHKYFPKKDISMSIKPTKYTTPYLEMMSEVIQEQKIIATNQGKAELLQRAFLSKMGERGIRESKALAKSMATCIRLPDSQHGGAYKQKKD
ncbi:MAG: hypothetical protein LBT45_02610 [Rickettsiales bacterium]|jgi:hypothetical protein|nr:hypothetical protein [Rickettsiales bacterium]